MRYTVEIYRDYNGKAKVAKVAHFPRRPRR